MDLIKLAQQIADGHVPTAAPVTQAPTEHPLLAPLSESLREAQADRAKHLQDEIDLADAAMLVADPKLALMAVQYSNQHQAEIRDLKRLLADAQATITELRGRITRLNLPANHPFHVQPAHPERSWVELVGQTFTCRDQIKAAGGRWNGGRKAWLVPGDQADRLQALVNRQPARDDLRDGGVDRHRSREDDGRSPEERADRYHDRIDR